MNGLLNLAIVVAVCWCSTSVYIGSMILQEKIIWLWHEWFIPELRTCYLKKRRQFKRLKRRVNSIVSELQYMWKII
jgi:hypothetical protein